MRRRLRARHDCRWVAALLAAMLYGAPVAIAASSPQPAINVAVDQATGLRIAPGWEQVRTHCGACHSYRLVTGNRGSRDHWRALIRWMQEKHNLWPLPADAEAEILAYLATAYAPAQTARRAPLPAHLRPQLRPVPNDAALKP